jgi:hypothetical protein
MSFDISFVNPDRNEYYLADRSTKGVDVVDINRLRFVRTAGLDKPFKEIVLNSAGTAVNNANSGPAGVVAHGRWPYAGDGDSTVHVIDLEARSGNETKQVVPSGGTKRVDEMALTSDGKLLLAANNADDPPFATLFHANGDSGVSGVSEIIRITVDPTILPPGFGLGIEQPAWDPTTKRFYTSIPTIANNPSGCNYGQLAGPITCSGGLLVTDPKTPTAVQGAYDPPPTPASSRSLAAGRMAPPSECMTICCSAARRATCRAARPLRSSMRLLTIMLRRRRRRKWERERKRKRQRLAITPPVTVLQNSKNATVGAVRGAQAR